MVTNEDKPWVPQWYWDISTGRETATRSARPRKAKTAARKARGGDCCSKERACGFESNVSSDNVLAGQVSYQTHCLAHYEDQGLFCYCVWVREEEEAECDVEEREGGDYRCC